MIKFSINFPHRSIEHLFDSASEKNIDALWNELLNLSDKDFSAASKCVHHYPETRIEKFYSIRRIYLQNKYGGSK